MDWTDYTRFGLALFALINPFTKIPYCLSVSNNGDLRSLMIVAMTSTISMISLLLLMHFAGEVILATLGTSLASFQIGGGLIIVLTGLALLRDDGQAAQQNLYAREPVDLVHFIKIGVAPLGIPMLAGAGAIAKVMNETHPAFGMQNEIHITVVIVAVCVICGVIIALGGFLSKVIGVEVLTIVGRLSGLIVVAVGAEVVWQGLATHISNLS